MKLSSCRYLVLVLGITDSGGVFTQDLHWVKCHYSPLSDYPRSVSISSAAYSQLYAALKKSRSTFNVTSASFHCVESIPRVGSDLTDSVPVDLGTPFIDALLSVRVRFTERGAAV